MEEVVTFQDMDFWLQDANMQGTFRLNRRHSLAEIPQPASCIKERYQVS